MRCHAVEAQLSAYLDEELDRETHARITDHLSDCSQCQATYLTLEAAAQQVRAALDALPMPPGLEAGILAHVFNESPDARPSATRWVALGALVTVAGLLGIAPIAILGWSTVRLLLGLTWHSIAFVPGLLGGVGTLAAIVGAAGGGLGALLLVGRLGPHGDGRPSYEP